MNTFKFQWRWAALGLLTGVAVVTASMWLGAAPPSQPLQGTVYRFEQPVIGADPVAARPAAYTRTGDTPPALQGLPASDAAARKLGYRNWDDYVARRPKNKLGRDEPEPAPQLRHAAYHVDPSSQTTPWVRNDGTDYQEMAQPADPADVQRIAAVDPNRMWSYPRIIGGRYVSNHTETIEYVNTIVQSCPECCATPPDRPAVTVSEPTTLALVLAGLVSLLGARRLRAQ